MSESTPTNNSPESAEQGIKVNVEKNETLEAFANYGLQEVMMEMHDLESQGFGKIEAVDNSIGLDEKVIEEVKIELGTEEELFTISQKALKALKKVMIAGMTTMALAGNAEADRGDVYLTDKKELKPVEDVLYGAKARDSMIARTESEAYLTRLIKETDGDVAEAKRVQQERLANLRNSIFMYTKDLKELEEVAKVLIADGLQLNTETSGLIAFSVIGNNPEQKERGVVATKEKIGEFATHELSHLATHSEYLIPKKTQERLSALLKTSKAEAESIEYYKQPTEVLARKHAIDEKMEKLGIKKYEEECTREHIQKLLRSELEKEGYIAGKEVTQEQIDSYVGMHHNDILPEGLEFIYFYGIEDAEKLFNEVAKNVGEQATTDEESALT